MINICMTIGTIVFVVFFSIFVLSIAFMCLYCIVCCLNVMNKLYRVLKRYLLHPVQLYWRASDAVSLVYAAGKPDS